MYIGCERRWCPSPSPPRAREQQPESDRTTLVVPSDRALIPRAGGTSRLGFKRRKEFRLAVQPKWGEIIASSYSPRIIGGAVTCLTSPLVSGTRLLPTILPTGQPVPDTERQLQNSGPGER